MSKSHSEKIKRKALRHFQQGFGYKMAAGKLGLPAYTVRNWYNHFRSGNLDWVRNSYVRTDSGLLEKAVQEYFSSEHGLQVLSVSYGISASTILRGYRNYLNYGTVTLPRGRNAMKKLLQLKQELAEQMARLDAGIPPTKKELKDMKDMGIVYSCLIDVLLEDENLPDAKKKLLQQQKRQLEKGLVSVERVLSSR